MNRREKREIPAGQRAVVGANVRSLRLRRGWTQRQLSELMGWSGASTTCRVERNREGRRRGLTVEELERLAAIFGVPASQLKHRCATCGGHPPAGFACLTCGARLERGQEPVLADTPPPRPDHHCR